MGFDGKEGGGEEAGVCEVADELVACEGINFDELSGV
jgi:hypothetical protein